MVSVWDRGGSQYFEYIQIKVCVIWVKMKFASTHSRRYTSCNSGCKSLLYCKINVMQWICERSNDKNLSLLKLQHSHEREPDVWGMENRFFSSLCATFYAGEK